MDNKYKIMIIAILLVFCILIFSWTFGWIDFNKKVLFSPAFSPEECTPENQSCFTLNETIQENESYSENNHSVININNESIDIINNESTNSSQEVSIQNTTIQNMTANDSLQDTENNTFTNDSISNNTSLTTLNQITNLTNDSTSDDNLSDTTINSSTSSTDISESRPQSTINESIQDNTSNLSGEETSDINSIQQENTLPREPEQEVPTLSTDTKSEERFKAEEIPQPEPTYSEPVSKVSSVSKYLKYIFTLSAITVVLVIVAVFLMKKNKSTGLYENINLQTSDHQIK